MFLCISSRELIQSLILASHFFWFLLYMLWRDTRDLTSHLELFGIGNRAEVSLQGCCENLSISIPWIMRGIPEICFVCLPCSSFYFYKVKVRFCKFELSIIPEPPNPASFRSPPLVEFWDAIARTTLDVADDLVLTTNFDPLFFN